MTILWVQYRQRTARGVECWTRNICFRQSTEYWNIWATEAKKCAHWVLNSDASSEFHTTHIILAEKILALQDFDFWNLLCSIDSPLFKCAPCKLDLWNHFLLLAAATQRQKGRWGAGWAHSVSLSVRQLGNLSERSKSGQWASRQPHYTIRNKLAILVLSPRTEATGRIQQQQQLATAIIRSSKVQESRAASQPVSQSRNNS